MHDPEGNDHFRAPSPGPEQRRTASPPVPAVARRLSAGADVLDATAAVEKTKPCPQCGRSFVSSRLDKHMRVCRSDAERFESDGK